MIEPMIEPQFLFLASGNKLSAAISEEPITLLLCDIKAHSLVTATGRDRPERQFDCDAPQISCLTLFLVIVFFCFRFFLTLSLFLHISLNL
jgi:hypothetical protein